MNIEIKDYLTLSDKRKYLVSSKILYNNVIYYLLTDLDNADNIKICVYTKNNTLIEIKDEKLIAKLVSYFARESLKIVREDNL